MKSRLSLIILFLAIFMLSVSSPASAAAPTVKLNGQIMTFDVEPVVENGRTLVPMRAIFEALGSTVLWDQYTTITATSGDITIKLQIGDTTAYKNNQAITLDVPPKVINGRTLVPLRFVGESLGATVNWDGPNNMVVITSSSQVGTPEQIYTASELFNKSSPAIVSINTYNQYGLYMGSGSGIIYDSSGKVITNYNVIDGAYSAKAKLADGTVVDVAKVVNYDINKDIAILQINATNLTTITLGDSNQLTQGQKFVMLSNPLGAGNRYSEGTIVSKDTQIDGRSRIKLSIPLELGGSGGALMNNTGKVTAIATAYLNNGQKITCGIPINEVQSLLQQNLDKTLSEIAGARIVDPKQAARIRYVVMCTGYKEGTYDPVNPTNEFPLNTSRVYACVILDKPISGSLLIIWGVYTEGGKIDMLLLDPGWSKWNHFTGQPGESNIFPYWDSNGEVSKGKKYVFQVSPQPKLGPGESSSSYSTEVEFYFK